MGNTFQPYSLNANTSPPPLFNSNPYIYTLHGGTRYTGGYFARYDMNKYANFYSEFGSHERPRKGGDRPLGPVRRVGRQL